MPVKNYGSTCLRYTCVCVRARNHCIRSQLMDCFYFAFYLIHIRKVRRVSMLFCQPMQGHADYGYVSQYLLTCRFLRTRGLRQLKTPLLRWLSSCPPYSSNLWVCHATHNLIRLHTHTPTAWHTVHTRGYKEGVVHDYLPQVGTTEFRKAETLLMGSWQSKLFRHCRIYSSLRQSLITSLLRFPSEHRDSVSWRWFDRNHLQAAWGGAHPTFFQRVVSTCYQAFGWR